MYIDDRIAEDIVAIICDLMFHHQDNPNGSDISCVFCGQDAPKNGAEPIEHREDCEGKRLLRALNVLPSESD